MRAVSGTSVKVRTILSVAVCGCIELDMMCSRDLCVGILQRHCTAVRGAVTPGTGDVLPAMGLNVSVLFCRETVERARTAKHQSVVRGCFILKNCN